jgi:hypothetical protein
MQNGGVQVVYVDRVLGGFEAEIVGGAVNHAWLYDASGQQVGEAVAVVVAAIMNGPESAKVENRVRPNSLPIRTSVSSRRPVTSGPG